MSNERTLFPIPELPPAKPFRTLLREVLTYSAVSTFQTCRRKYKLRNVDYLVPIEKAHALRYGTVTHQWLEAWHRTRSLPDALAIIDAAYVNRGSDPAEKRDWHFQTATANAYADLWSEEPFEVVALEQEFEGPLLNPVSRRTSRSFVLKGKIDGIIRYGEAYHLIEHKTSSMVTGDYIERLGMDLQILLYSYYARIALKYPVSGILYNVLPKPRLTQSEGETQEQYEARKAELEAKSKTGKPSTAKRKLPETDDEFQARLTEWFAAEPRFTRVELLLDFDAVDNVRHMLWDISKEILDARRNNKWHQNTRACHGFGRCAYWPICSSHNNPLVIETSYTKRAPNEELASEEEPEPVF